MRRRDRVAGAVVGSAVGDALGAPYEFGPPGAFSARFPHGVGEMRAGGGWEAGEATDDTQMAVLTGESLLRCGGLDPAGVFAGFRRWAAWEPKDIGLQTEAVLTSGEPWDRAAALHAAENLRSAGNGALMRSAPAAVYFAPGGRAATMTAARRLAALTHGDPAAWEGSALLHDLVRAALDGGDPLAALPAALAATVPEHRDRWARVLDPAWHPDDATEFNGAVWPCLASAVWALRTTDDFTGALRAAVGLGGDTDTVAAVTGALAGTVYGLPGIPPRWTAPLWVPLPATTPRAPGAPRPPDRTLGAPQLVALAAELDRAGHRAAVGG